MKKLVLCFDGTWKSATAGAASNVVRLYRSIRGSDYADVPDGTPDEGAPVETRKWYDPGLGTTFATKITGGAFGYGIDRNIREGYNFLCTHYDPGDEIYLFGFSRGAYTARSLAGLTRTAGAIRREHLSDDDPDDDERIKEAYELYRRRGEGPDSPTIRRFRADYCHEVVPIKVIGVWDTVGSLGIPDADEFNAAHLGFHDTRLSSRIEHAFHALAIDEHRPDYPATLWEIEPGETRDLQQVWFVGAHSDVGGGYPNQPLSDITLEWMQRRVELHGAGLALDQAQIPDVRGLEVAGLRVTDSYHEALHGLYARFRDRSYRPIAGGPLHSTARDKLRVDQEYRPKNPGIDGQHGGSDRS